MGKSSCKNYNQALHVPTVEKIIEMLLLVENVVAFLYVNEIKNS